MPYYPRHVRERLERECGTFFYLLYGIQGAIYAAYIISLGWGWYFSRVPRERKSFIRTMVDIGAVVLVVCGGYAVDVLMTGAMDITMTGYECATFNTSRILDNLIRFMTILIYLGWKIILVLLIWQKQQYLIRIFRALV